MYKPTPMSTAALFKVARHGNNLSVHRWMNEEEGDFVIFNNRRETIVLSEINWRKTNIIWYHLYLESKTKLKQTNKKQAHWYTE